MEQYTEYMAQMMVNGKWVGGRTYRGVPINRRRKREDLERQTVDIVSAWEQELRYRKKHAKPFPNFPVAWRIVEREVTITDWRVSE